MIAVADPIETHEIESEIATETTPKKRGGGPRTPEGKERSRRNALKHGLLARIIVPDDLADAVAGRNAELSEEFGPRTPYEHWLVAEVARATVKLDRCAEMTVVDLQRCIDRAVICWESDRRAHIEDLGARLPKDPSRVASALNRTRQGVEWLLERWEGLGEVLEVNGGWDEPQRRLALDLLGVPIELRDGSRKVPPGTDAPALAQLVATQVQRLRDRLEATLNDLDEATQAMAASGMPFEEDAATARLRRYEARARRAMLWALAELRRVRERAEPDAPGESPTSHAESSPAPTARPEPSGAAIDYLVKRSRLVNLALPESPPVAEPAAAVAEPATTVAEAPGVARTTLLPLPSARVPTHQAMPTSTATPNLSRRERRAREKRARQAERRGGR